MKKNILLLLIILLSVQFSITAQNSGLVRGTVIDKNTQETIVGASISVEKSTEGTVTDIDGVYKLNLPVGTYNLKASFLGYTTIVKYNITASSGNAQIVNFELESSANALKEVTIVFDNQKSAVATDMITPLSVQQLTTEEIKSNPGGNFDLSKVVQTLPGVGGSSTAQRNDIVIRGGAPNENVYYLDGIEIPVLNHFQTQGSSGGAQGILNVSFIEDVKLSSSAFDAKYDNMLASVFQIKQREGNPERLSGNIRLSGTEFATTLEGPLSKKTNFLVSARRSYLQFLFQALDLPIRPNFWDFQYKVTHKINAKTTLTAIGLGAIDDFYLAATKNSTPENEYIVRSQPLIKQWNYTNGFALKRLINNGYVNIALSRNMFNNQFDKFENQQNNDETKRTLGLNSQEIENKLRIDVNKFINGWKFSYGVVGQYTKYYNKLYNKLLNEVTDSIGNVITPAYIVQFKSNMEFFKYGAFGQVAKNFFNDRLLVSTGVRSDMNNFTTTGNNPLKTISLRLSLSYNLTNKIDLNASVGTYYKIPTYTILGYKDGAGNFANKNVDYIKSTHYVLGTQYLPKESLRFTVEGFYKQYSNYPVSVINGISIANLGGDFGAIGNEQVISSGKGETYGVEFFAQQKLVKNLFVVFSYTYVRSKFSGLNGKMIASAWDNQNLLSTTLGYKFKRGWDLGIKYRYAGGLPNTPFNLAQSQQNYGSLGVGILDYSQINTQRLKAFNQLDLRVDKKLYFAKTSLNLFIDIQNALLSKTESAPNYTFKRKTDNSDFETTDEKALKADGSNGIPVVIKNENLSVIPSVGFIFEF